MLKMKEISINDLSSFGLLIGFIAVFFILIVYHGLCLWGAQAIYNRHAKTLIAKRQFLRMEIFFFMGLSALAFIHLSEIGILSLLGLWHGVASSIDHAIVVIGGIYTTIGSEQAVSNLPSRYRILAVVLSMSSLFCFAWSTAVMMDMMRTYRKIRSSGGTSVSDD
jgi:predicted small integral membrane protein